MNDQDQLAGSGKASTNWKLWAIGAAVILLLIFVFQNSQEVKIDFLVVTTTTPLIFGLLIAGLLGFLIGWLAPKVRRGHKAERKR